MDGNFFISYDGGARDSIERLFGTVGNFSLAPCSIFLICKKIANYVYLFLGNF